MKLTDYKSSTSYVIPICIILFCACNPCKRIGRIAARNGCIQTDTITLNDTVYSDSSRIDTVAILGQTDTLVIENDRFRTTVIRRVDTFEVTTFVKPDTIIRTIKVPFEKIVVQDSLPNWFWYIIAFCGLLIVVWMWRSFKL